MSASHDAHARTHDHVFLGDAHDRNARRTLWVVALTAATMVGEIMAGLAFNSMALLADGFHMATHAGALAVAAGAYAFARRYAHDPRFSFGTGKVGDLAGYTSALLLGVISIGIAWESIQRLIDPRPVVFGEATLVAALGLAVNLVSAWLLSGDGHDHGHAHGGHHGHDHAHRGHDNNLRAAYIHVLADAGTSVLAIVALVLGRQLGWVWLDAVVGIVGAVVIAVWALGLIRASAKVLVDASETDRIAEVREKIEGAGDAHVTDLHVWQVGPGAHSAIIALVAPQPLTPGDYRKRLSGIGWISHATIEVSQCEETHR